MSKGKHLDNVKKEMTLTEKILSYIPGYRGYKEKEIRRESDRLVRMEATNRLKEVKDIIRMKLTKLAQLGKIEDRDVPKFEVFLSRLDRIIVRIEKAPAGYAGLFDAVKVKEDKLDKILEHDLMLIEESRNMKELAGKFEKLEAREDLLKSVEELLTSVRRLEEIIDRRTEILRGISE
ncbi:MAG: hypothetical protein QXE44_05385 [Nitrososphaerota archaeon]